jgi:microcystin-dependent protein
MKKLLQALSLVVAASLGAAAITSIASHAAFWQWSTTASTNATADPTINWAEGMSPSSVNDSARAMMAALAKWRNDIGGVNITAGTSAALTLTTSSGGFVADAAHDGSLIGFTASTANAAGVTLNVDGAGAKLIRVATATAAPAAAITTGGRYLVSYRNSTDDFLLVNYVPPQFEVPLGTMLAYTGDNVVPNANYVTADGRCISRATYATYFALVGTAYGACDGTSTFGVPDMRGRFPGGSDQMGAFGAAGRITNVGCVSNFFNVNGLTCGAQNRTIASTNLPALTGVTTSIGQNFLTFDGSNLLYASGGNVDPRPTNSGVAVLSVTVNSGSPNTTMPAVPPSQVVNYIVRVI